jgi:uncharacterized membrane protein
MNKISFNWKWKDTLLLLISLIPLGIGLLLYKDLPNNLASHFGLQGEANGYMSKPTFFIFMGLLNVIFPIVLKVMPSIDPKKANYEKFLDIYELLRFVLAIFLNIIFIIVLYYNLGYNVSMNLILHLLLGSLWIMVGNYMGRIRPNYIVGVRTPWTLSNDEVWRKTHRFTGPIWVLCGIAMVISGFIGSITVPYVLIASIVISAVLPTVYSYLIFRKINGRSN